MRFSASVGAALLVVVPYTKEGHRLLKSKGWCSTWDQQQHKAADKDACRHGRVAKHGSRQSQHQQQ